jgi:tight adherence protein C
VSLDLDPIVLSAVLTTGVGTALLLGVVFPPPRRLHSRVRPYVTPTIATLTQAEPTGVVASVFGPIVRDAADRVASLLDRAGSEVSLVKIRQAGWFRDLGESAMVSAYRVVQLKTLAIAVALALIVGQLFGGSLLVRLVLVVLGLVVGATRTKGRLDRAIDTRRELMKIEIYTVNQLMAMRVRAGGGVVQAVQATVQRGHGEVIGELEEALRLHRAGWAAADAFRRIAELTPEPFCSRTYRLLGSAEERGADLAGALLSLSEDVRETRRESVKRTATKRRAAMLVPTIAILAPVLILFVAAPLPHLITSWQ